MSGLVDGDYTLVSEKGEEGEEVGRRRDGGEAVVLVDCVVERGEVLSRSGEDVSILVVQERELFQTHGMVVVPLDDCHLLTLPESSLEALETHLLLQTLLFFALGYLVITYVGEAGEQVFNEVFASLLDTVA